MEWIFKLMFLGIVIGIVRKYPKISIILAILGLLLYNQQKKYIPQNNASPSNIYSSKNYNSPELKPEYQLNTSIRSLKTELEIPQSTKNNLYKKEAVTNTRIGAICNDGTSSKATGRGACSHHGGVAYWLYE
ncbi:hypothetical protein H0I23_04320 [Cellulophaga sp. HaHaR_3_176]|uniref:DUF3761 domain-containing protein n=1 Tax=Cellulophaga sp. HaHaR_3_176 TaxID=1942464 RepID=UPI001C1FFA5C|nr:DUF3761 domain-containing protein [Cellulophaga sp. HaHaR_3_176]QWX84875.1 hypothetical protein H0I23_04320 [Cellulophaga sp. HaHaR_3_176]